MVLVVSMARAVALEPAYVDNLRTREDNVLSGVWTQAVVWAGIWEHVVY